MPWLSITLVILSFVLCLLLLRISLVHRRGRFTAQRGFGSTWRPVPFALIVSIVQNDSTRRWYQRERDDEISQKKGVTRETLCRCRDPGHRYLIRSNRGYPSWRQPEPNWLSINWPELWIAMPKVSTVAQPCTLSDWSICSWRLFSTALMRTLFCKIALKREERFENRNWKATVNGVIRLRFPGPTNSWTLW